MSEQAEVKVRLVFDKSASTATKDLVAEVGKVKTATGLATESKKTFGDKAKEAGKKALDAITPNVKALDNLKSAANLTKGALGALGTGAGILAASGAALGAAALYAGVSAAYEKAERTRTLAMQLVSFAPKKNISINDAQDAAQAYDRTFRQISGSSGQAQEEISEAFKTIASQPAIAAYGYEQFSTKARLSLSQAETVTRNMAAASKSLGAGGIGKLSKEYEDLRNGIFSSQGAIVQMITTTGVLKGNAAEVARQLGSKGPEARMKLAEEAMARMAKLQTPMGFGGLKTSVGAIGGGIAASFGEPIVNKLLPMLERARSFLEANSSKIEMYADKVGSKIAGFIDGTASIVTQFYDVFSGGEGDIGDAIESAFDFAQSAFKWIVDNATPIAQTFKDVFGVVLKAIEKAFLMLQAAGIALGGGKGENEAAAENRSSIMKRVGSEKMSDKEYRRIRSGEGKEAGSFSEKGSDAWLKELDRAHAHFVGITSSFDAAAKRMNGSDFVNAYNQAAIQHDDAALKYAQSLLRGNSELQDAMLKSGKDVEGGFRGLAKLISDSVFVDKADAAAKAKMGEGAAARKIEFNGATFNLKQDFRDQDPDRVAIVFRRDILAAASQRTTAATSLPFGM